MIAELGRAMLLNAGWNVAGRICLASMVEANIVYVLIRELVVLTSCSTGSDVECKARGRVGVLRAGERVR